MDSEIRAAMSARMDKLLDETEKLLVKNLSEVRGTRAALKESRKEIIFRDLIRIKSKAAVCV